MTEETCSANDCIDQAEIQRYDRMKWGVLALLVLIPLLLWLLSWAATSTDTAQQQQEQVQVNLYLNGVAIPWGTSSGITLTQHVVPHYIEVTRLVPVTPEVTSDARPEALEITREIEVTREVQVTHEVEVTREVEVTHKVEVTREVEITRQVPVTVTEQVPVVVTREVTVTPSSRPHPTETPPQGSVCTRFDFEEGRDAERGSHGAGRYEMREVLSNRLVADWYAEDGWLDSGWIENRAISRESVHVSVFFYPAAGGGPIELEIVNPAPNTIYGWVSRGMCHAVELQFPPGY